MVTDVTRNKRLQANVCIEQAFVCKDRHLFVIASICLFFIGCKELCVLCKQLSDTGGRKNSGCEMQRETRQNHTGPKMRYSMHTQIGMVPHGKVEYSMELRSVYEVERFPFSPIFLSRTFTSVISVIVRVCVISITFRIRIEQELCSTG